MTTRKHTYNIRIDGITKDGIEAIDAAVRHDGWLKSANDEQAQVEALDALDTAHSISPADEKKAADSARYVMDINFVAAQHNRVSDLLTLGSFAAAEKVADEAILFINHLTDGGMRHDVTYMLLSALVDQRNDARSLAEREAKSRWAKVDQS